MITLFRITRDIFYRIFHFIGIGLIACNKQTITNNKDISEKTTNVLISREQSLSYNIDTCIFDAYPIEKKQQFLLENKSNIAPILFRYYPDYNLIENLDTLYRVLIECKTNDKVLTPYYYYVLREISKNNHIDGYIGEAIWDKDYEFFVRQPDYFYKYISYLTQKKDSNSIKEISYNINFTISNSGENSDINQIFKDHRKHTNDSIIDKIKRFITKN